MNKIVLVTTLTLVTAAPLATRAADFPENPNRFNLGARFGFNFKGSFRNDSASSPNPGPAASGADHFYNNGYVLLDSSGNAGGLTWNWGYQNASQVVGDTIEFQAVEPTSPFVSSANDFKDDPQYGAELTYQRVLGRMPSGRWGFEAGFGYTYLDLSDAQSVTGAATVTTDSFPLNGVIPPGAGYNGTFQGPGALLGDTPTRSVSAAIATQTLQQKLSGYLFTIRLGPFAEWDLTPRLRLAASVGLTLAPSQISYDIIETTTLDSGPAFMTGGHASTTELLYGPYVSAMLHYDFAECWGAYVGAQFQSLNDLEQSFGSRTAELDMGATFYGTVGLSFRF